MCAGRYEPAAYYYELLSIFRRGAFGLIAVLGYSPQMQCFAAQIVLIIHFVAQVKYNPYIDSKLDVVETILAVTLLILSMCGMVISVAERIFVDQPQDLARNLGILTSICSSMIGIAMISSLMLLLNDLFEMAYTSYLKHLEFISHDKHEHHGDAHAHADLGHADLGHADLGHAESTAINVAHLPFHHHEHHAASLGTPLSAPQSTPSHSILPAALKTSAARLPAKARPSRLRLCADFRLVACLVVQTLPERLGVTPYPMVFFVPCVLLPFASPGPFRTI